MRVLRRRARLPALHRGTRHRPEGGGSAPGRVSGRGHWRPSRPASTSQSGLNAARHDARSRPSAGLRDLPAGTAPRSVIQASLEDALDERGRDIGIYSRNKVKRAASTNLDRGRTRGRKGAGCGAVRPGCGPPKRATRREQVRRHAYQCVVAAARNRQNQLRPSSPLWPVVTRRVRSVTRDMRQGFTRIAAAQPAARRRAPANAGLNSSSDFGTGRPNR